MEWYTSDEANFLIKYYENKMIGKILESSTKAIVERLEIEDNGNGKYRVNAIGNVLPGLLRTRRSIDLVAKDLKLPSPEEALRTSYKSFEKS